jgi:predicted amidohydrolase YtcJ
MATIQSLVDLAILNGVVWRPGAPPATAVAVSDGRIAAVGSDADVRALIGNLARVLDARGGTILPAFNDAHVHFLMGSRGLSYLDLFGVDTQPEIEQRIRDFAAANAGRWLMGRGWFYSAFPGGMPTLELLDRLIPDRPAYMESFDTHCAWVNSRALEAAGISPHDSDGVLKERAMEDFERHLPIPTAAQDMEALRAGMRIAAAHGVASVQEASRGLEQLPLYQTLHERDELTMRVRLAFDMTPGLSAHDWEMRLDTYEDARRQAAAGGAVATGILKAFADGVVESKTAALSEPYADMSATDPGAYGTPLWEPGELALAIRAADRRGWQVEVHAIGDAAIRDALDAYAGLDPARRHRVEHIEAPAADDIPRFGRLGVIASMQPQHAAPNLIEVWRRHLGPARAARGWPWKEILESGGRLAFGTDWPVVYLDPFASLAEATKALSVIDAVAAWTSGAAYAEHAEDSKGRLHEGMLADIAVLDRDLARTPPGEIASTKVEATVVGGRLVYES